MKCKSVVFLILIMLIASGVSAFALTTGEKYDAGDITNLQTFFTERYGATTEDWQLNGYTISADGIYMVFEVYRTVFTAPATDSTAMNITLHGILWIRQARPIVIMLAWPWSHTSPRYSIVQNW